MTFAHSLLITLSGSCTLVSAQVLPVPASPGLSSLYDLSVAMPSQNCFCLTRFSPTGTWLPVQIAFSFQLHPRCRLLFFPPMLALGCLDPTGIVVNLL